jgi:quinol monooxygenase YgiN
MFIISGEFKVKDEHRDELIKMSLDLIPQSLTESGCISYDFLESQTRPGNFLFFERWSGRSDISEHFEKSYFKNFGERFPDMIEGEASIEIHEIASTERV